MIRRKREFVHVDLFHTKQIEDHKHREYELLFVLEGNINLKLEDKYYRLKKDDVVLVNSFKKHGLYQPVSSGQQGLCAVIKVSTDAVEYFTNSNNNIFMCYSFMESEKQKYDELRYVLRRILQNFATDDGKNHPIQLSDYYLLIHVLVNYFLVSSENADKEEDWYERIKRFVDEHYFEEISLTDLSETVNMSSSYISRMFKKQFGMNFVDYIYDVRLKYAAEQLLETDDSITEIAFDNGFPNIATFNKQFKGKFELTPTDYRKKHEGSSRDTLSQNAVIAKEIISDYLGMTDIPASRIEADEKLIVKANANVYNSFNPIWNMCMNLGMAEGILSQEMQSSIVYAKSSIKFRYGRIVNIFSEGMYIVGLDGNGLNRFNRLDRVIDFLLANDITPVIELGEKHTRIQQNVTDYLKDFDNVSSFKSYEEFLNVLEETMKHFIRNYTEQVVNKWAFELWDDRRIEMYADKKAYIKVYSDARKIIKKHAPDAMVGGAGNFIGWNKTHTEESLRVWIDNGVYPDFLTYTYYPYSNGEFQSIKMSKRKADEDDMSHTLDELKESMDKFGFPKRPVFFTEWNMTSSSRNYFNDSLWKACYIAKCYIDNIGKVDSLVCSQLQDSITDYYDNQQLLNGSGGLLTRDLIDKPAFIATRLFRHLQKYIVDKGENYIITRDEYNKITIIIHNFIKRSYMYFLKEENENQINDHYSYFQGQNTKSVHIELEGMGDAVEYELHHHILNRQNGSIMDEWAELGYKESFKMEDIEYLKKITRPKILFSNVTSKNDVLEIDLVLQPLELRCISIIPQ